MLIHATTVAIDARAVLILGPSGTGKSGLGLQLMALGAQLLADDQTLLLLTDGVLTARCPPELAGMIEARGVGILRAAALDSAPVALAVDLGRTETERLPPQRRLTLLGQHVPLLHSAASGHFSAAILQYMRSGRSA